MKGVLKVAKYTIELRDVVKHYPIFSFPYPFYDEHKRREFEQSFIRHFYFREICCPSVEQFLFYLEDKFQLVFPYYNELMRTATLEYDIENPYNLTETYTRNVDSMGESRGIYSGVDQMQRSETGNTETESSSTRKEDQHGTGKSTTTDNSTSKTVGNEVVDGESSRNATTTDNGKNSNTTNETTKFLDTPQGAVDLDSIDYLTNLTNKKTEGSGSSENTQTVKDGSESLTETDSTSTTTGNATSVTDSETECNVTENGSSEGKTIVQTEGEQKVTQDSNTRNKNEQKQVETYTMVRKGNIGVNPASHEIDCHIVTQKTLKRIEEMFFNECEDLFMLVW